MRETERIDFASSKTRVMTTSVDIGALAARPSGTALLEKTRLSMMRYTHQAVESTKGKRAVCPKAANDER
jgi:hypothetical protein